MILSSKHLLKRKIIYKSLLSISKKNKIKNINSLFFNQKILYINEIKYLIKLYIRENLQNTYKKKFGIDSYYTESKKILKLRNVTPNGIINPREETQFIYRLIVDYIFKSMSTISPYIATCTIPVIRYRAGMLTKELKNRPYATSKIHSDAWVGQHGDAIMTLGILGDCKNNGVNFYYPEKISSNFFKKIDDYNIGDALFNKKTKIGILELDRWHLFDHGILHNSFIKNNSKPRISIDFGVKLSKSMDKNQKINKRWDYHDIKKFKDVSSCAFLKFDKSIHSKIF